MSEMMIERVARAAYERYHELQNVGLSPEEAAARFAPWGKLPPWTRSMYIEAQRAAIAAMREPTEAMCLCDYVTYPPERAKDDGLAKAYAANAADWWRAMIDAALSPQPKPVNPSERPNTDPSPTQA